MFGDSWRGVRGREDGSASPGCTTCGPLPGSGIGISALQRTVNTRRDAAAAKFFSQSMPMVDVQNVGIPPGSPVSAFNTMHFAGVSAPSGLGAIFGCASFQAGLSRLKTLLAQAKTNGTTGPAVDAAQALVEEYDATFSLHVIYNDASCVTMSAEVDRIGAALAQALNGPGWSALAPNAEAEAMPLFTKVALIGGLAVAGIIGIAVITGQVAPLLRAAKRVLP
jgi:hypothetical protein